MQVSFFNDDDDNDDDDDEDDDDDFSFQLTRTNASDGKSPNRIRSENRKKSHSEVGTGQMENPG